MKVVYQITYQPDSLNQATRRSENAVLLFGEGFSIFTTKNNLLEDSAKQSLVAKMRLAHTNGISLVGLPRSYFHYTIYKNYKDDLVSTVDKIGINLYRYEEPRASFSWKITAEKQIIVGYNCRKAVTSYGGRNYEVWFTSDIPVSEGPYKFWGLPGLIVAVNDLHNYYSFKLIRLINIRENTLIFPEIKKLRLLRAVILEKPLKIIKIILLLN